MLRRNVGFSALTPQIRLVVVLVIGALFIFIHTIPAALALLATGLVLFLLEKNRSWKLAASAVFTGGSVLFYNLIFSPVSSSGIHWFIFSINFDGLTRGLMMSFRMMGMMFTSFAWLAATPYPEMYKSIEWFVPGREWSLGSIRGVQILQREFIALTQSLIVRGLKWNSIADNIKNLVPLGTAIIPRVLENSQKSTLASVSHKKPDPKGLGDIKVSDLFARYSPELAPALRGINFSVEPGEFVYLAGKNMAGKTTLLRVLGAVIPRIMGEFKGSVEVSGNYVHRATLSEVSASARYIAPDPFASIYGLTVGQEISFLTESETEGEKALAVMGIEDLWERETTKLSGGQQVRLVLAGALASKAKVLLLDAPMQELDPSGRADFIEALSIVRQERSTTVLVADPFWEELRTNCQRVLVLEDGLLKGSFIPGAFFTPETLETCNLNKVPLSPLSISSGNTVSRLEGVEVTLDGNNILRGIDFSVSEGELVTIVGPNGSGKTTAMLTLAEALKPSKGKVTNRGRVGYIFQNAALQLLAMTVSEELAFGPKVLKWEGLKTDEFVKQSVSWTELSPDACPLDLHPAEQRLLAIAACNTDVSTLIFDEPTIGLDSQGVTKVVELIDTLRSRGKAVVVITHDEHLARHADRVVTIEKGRISKEIRRSDLEGGDADGTHPGA